MSQNLYYNDKPMTRIFYLRQPLETSDGVNLLSGIPTLSERVDKENKRNYRKL